MKKTLSLILCAILMISCVFTLFSCGEDYGNYAFDSIKINEVSISGQDFTEMFEDLFNDAFAVDDLKKMSIEFGSKTIVINESDSKSEYSYTMDGDEIVLKNISFDIAKEAGLNDAEMRLYLKGSKIEWVCSGNVSKEGINLFISMSFFFKKQ